MSALNGIIVERLRLLGEYVRQLEGYRTASVEDLRADTGLAWAVEHGLQLSVQCVIDV